MKRNNHARYNLVTIAYLHRALEVFGYIPALTPKHRSLPFTPNNMHIPKEANLPIRGMDGDNGDISFLYMLAIIMVLDLHELQLLGKNVPVHPLPFQYLPHSFSYCHQDGWRYPSAAL